MPTATTTIPTKGSKAFQILFLVSILWAPLCFGAVYLWSFSLSALLLAVALGLRLRGWPACGARKIVRTGLELWIALFLSIFILSLTFSRVKSVSAVETYKLTAYILTFYATVLFCEDRPRLRLLCGIIIFFGGVLSFAGLLQYVGALPRSWWHIQRFLSAVYVNHNHFAGLLEMLLPVSLGLAIAERDTSRKTLSIFLVALMGTAFIFTLSRGGYLSLLAGLAVMFALLLKKGLLKNGWLAIAVAVILAAAAGCWFGWAPAAQRVRTLGVMAAGDLSGEDRLLMWKGAWQLIRHNPWLGTGPGTFEFAFLRYRPAGFTGRPVFAHDDWLNVAADCGILAWAAVILLFAALVRLGLRVIHQDDSRLKASVGAGCIGAIVALGVHSTVDFNWHIPANALWLAVIAGLLVSLNEPRRSFGVINSFAAKATAALAASALIVFAAASIFWGASDYFLWKAKVSPASQGTASVGDLDRSIRINPFNAKAYYLRGLARKGTAAALSDFNKAVELSPLEPYYDYQRIKHLLSDKKTAPGQAVALMQAVVDKDPMDPKLCYLAASCLMRMYPQVDSVIEKWAKALSTRCVGLESDYLDPVCLALWEYEGKPATVEAFKARVWDDSRAVLWFLSSTDQWELYRPYFLKSLGIDPERKYRLLDSTPWGTSVATLGLGDFTPSVSHRILEGDCLFANGQLSKAIKLESSVSRLVLTARGSKAGRSYPMVLVKLDGRVIDAIYVASPYESHLYSILEAIPGTHTLALEFINDFRGGIPAADRNVWITNIEIQNRQG